MRIRKKIIMSGLAIATMGTVLGFGGFAFASAIQNRGVASVSRPSESSMRATVTGVQAGTLLPGERALIAFFLTNPNSNVNARLLQITPVEIFIDSVVDPADAAYCHDQLELSPAGADLLLPVIAVSAANFPFDLRWTVKLKDDTDARCQGMTFHTTWTTKFEAVR